MISDAPVENQHASHWGLLGVPAWAWLAGIILLGTALRLYHLDSSSLTLDEAISVNTSRDSLANIWDFVAVHHDSHPPLYYVAVHFWIGAFGEADLSVRMFSALCGIAAIPVTYKLGDTLYGRRVGLLAALFVAVSPFMVIYSQEVRMYSMLFLLAVSSAFCLAKAVQTNRLEWWAAYAVLTIAALYTDNGGIWYAMASSLYAAFAVRTRRGLWAPFVISQIVIALAYLPFVPILLEQADSYSGNASAAHSRRSVGEVFLAINSYRFDVWQVNYAFVVLMLAGVHLVFLSRRRQRHWPFPSFLLLVPICASFIVSFHQNIFLLRNLIVAAAGYYLLLAVLVDYLADKRGRIALAAVALTALFVTMNASSLMAMYNDEESEPWREASRYISEHAGPNDLAFFNPRYIETPFHVSSPRRFPVATFSPSRTNPAADDASDALVNEAMRQAVAGFTTVWLIRVDYHTLVSDPKGVVKQWFDAHAVEVTRQRWETITVSEYRLAPQ